MKNNLKIISLLVMGLTLVGKIVSLIRDILIAAEYGTSFEADAYNISYAIVILFFGLANAAIYNTILPFMTEELKKGEKSFFSFLNNILGGLVIISTIFIMIVFSFADFFVNLVAPEISFRTHELTINLTRILIVSLIFLTLNSVFNAVLRIYEKYYLPSIGALLFSIPSLVFLVFYTETGIFGLSIATVFGFLLQTSVQIPFIIKTGFRFTLKFNFLDKRLRKIVFLMPPIIMSSGVVQINTIVDTIFASTFGEGSITILTLASKVNGIVFTVIGTSLLSIFYPILTKKFAEKNMHSVVSKINETFSLIILLILPISILVIIFNEEIIKILFMRNEFNEDSSKLTALVLIGYTVGLVFFVLRDLLVFSFYANKDMKTPLVISIISIIVNIALNFIFTNFTNWNLFAISLATSIAAIINFYLLYFSFNKKIVSLKCVGNYDLYKTLFGGLVIFLTTNGLKELLKTNTLENIIIICSISGFFYLAILLLLKHSFFNMINVKKFLIKKKFNIFSK